MTSNQSTVDGTSGIAAIDHHLRQVSTAGATARTRRALATLAFWSAIALPGLYLPLLLTGIGTIDRLGLFVGLVGLHVVALVGGRRHRV